MRVTGIITCHNYADLVGRAIASFFGQDYPEKRLIVIDDGSSDNSWDAIQAATRETPCPCDTFRVDEAMGQGWAKNFGIEHGWENADAFAFLDADDEYASQKVSKSVALLAQQYGKVGLVYSDDRIVDEMTGTFHIDFKPGFSLESLVQYNCVGGNFLASKKLFEGVGRFDESMRVSEDYDLALRAVEKHILLHVPEPLVTVTITNRALKSRVASEEWDYHNRLAIARAQQRHGKTKA